MPTNLFRRLGDALGAKRAKAYKRPDGPRTIVITVGRVALRAELLDTLTADRVWSQLPLFSTAETWGAAVTFEVPVETGREKTAKTVADPGDICFWTEDDRIVIAYGRTPISKAGEARLPKPCNVWARALDDATLLKSVTPGEKVSVKVA
jgi:uncharacterized protein